MKKEGRGNAVTDYIVNSKLHFDLENSSSFYWSSTYKDKRFIAKTQSTKFVFQTLSFSTFNPLLAVIVLICRHG